jgi:DNA-binding response OmpR family regulator
LNREDIGMPHILLIDDDVALTEMLVDFLGQEGFAVDVRHDGMAGLEALRDRGTWPDLVILDVMMPQFDGFEVLAKLHVMGQFPPVLMLTARGEEDDRIAGLEQGADDYLSKPFNPRELVARLRIMLRRRPQDTSERSEVVTVGSLHMDCARLAAQIRGVGLSLTAAEFRVLECLVRHVGRVVSRSDLTEYALGRKLELYDRSVDTHVSNVRRKIGLFADFDMEIRGVRGAGYQLTPPNAS